MGMGFRMMAYVPANACMVPTVGNPSFTSPGTAPEPDANMPYKAGSKNVAVTILPENLIEQKDTRKKVK